MPHSRNSDAAGKIESAVSVSCEAAGDLTKDSIYHTSLDKEQFPPHPGESNPSAGESTKDSIYCTSLDKEQFPPHPGESDPSGADESDIVSVHLSQDESLIVPVSVQGTNLQGVLDCGAGACII